ncbi:MAG: DUF389 domain-containing protein [Jatrophihabitans sp.]
MMQLRVISPAERSGAVIDLLTDECGAVAITSTDSSDGTIVTADIARECAGQLLDRLRRQGFLDDGMVSLTPLDTAIGSLAKRAEDNAPGEGADALIWDDLAARTGEDSTLTWTFLIFMVLATTLAAIGVVNDSQITVVGAMVIGPEFGPLAGLAVALLRRQADIARQAGIALVAGFVLAITATALLSLLGVAAGLFDASNLSGQHGGTDFIYHPGWFSLITALVAGAAGMLSLTSSKSSALVGVFISVTTIPAAGNAAVAAVLGKWHIAAESMLQLGINLVGIVVAGVLTLLLLKRIQGRRSPEEEAEHVA